jgi:uncharacterized membrane protein YgdD (TMEM256/DUF423 family)
MRPWVIFAGLNGAVAVALGAYAAHGLEGDAQALAERASLYQLLHALALLAADRLVADGRQLAHGAALSFAAGSVLFSGSLYLKALTGGPLAVPLLTPAGGIAFMLGWVMLAIAGLSRSR